MTKLSAFINLTRINKPIGIFLLLWPTLTALFLASGGFPNTHILLIFILGTIIMRSAGCIINDLIDCNIDPLVKRTRNRPIAAGIIRPKEAIIVLLLLLICAIFLVMQLNIFSFGIAFLALLFSLTYPFTKRFFVMPQVYLGITFGFGILMAFSAIQDTLPLEAIILFIANVFWAVSYDSHYAIMDMEDDKKININSTALFFGNKIMIMITLSYFFMFINLIFIGILKEFNLIFFLMLAIALVIALYGCFESRYMESQKNFEAFLRNNYVGIFVFIGFVSQLY
ncbi:MAG: 4-hydroxybenzoate octaprenyltransferase [Methylophilaceae bacterium]